MEDRVLSEDDCLGEASEALSFFIGTGNPNKFKKWLSDWEGICFNNDMRDFKDEIEVILNQV